MSRVTAFAVATVALAVVLTGCRDSAFPIVPVSGKVTLDGEPLAGARVKFQPFRQGEAEIAGPGSFARTDEQGRYSLETIRGDNGAVVGKHRVRIRTRQEEEVNGRVKVVRQEEVPARYNARTELSCAVTSGGANAANFELTTD